MKPKKITFLFNQLTLPELCTGGEIRGYTIASFFKNDKKQAGKFGKTQNSLLVLFALNF